MAVVDWNSSIGDGGMAVKAGQHRMTQGLCDHTLSGSALANRLSRLGLVVHLCHSAPAGIHCGRNVPRPTLYA